MNYLTIGKQIERASQLALGCMRMADCSLKEAVAVLDKAQEIGINFFDHADVYGMGEAEKQFSKALVETGLKREEIIIQSKCGLIVGENYYFDFSKKHIIASVEASLTRLNTDYLDVLLLHRPDALMEPEEVASAFEHLYQSGKVRNFGVSNQNPYQIELLQSAVSQPLIINQMQYGPTHTPMIDAGLNVNVHKDAAIIKDGGVLDYCRLKNIKIQPWSPFQVDLKQGLFMKHSAYQKLTEVLNRYAIEYSVSFEAMVMAWIMRHPADMQPIIGSMNSDRIQSMSEVFGIQLSRQVWYDIYKSAGNALP